MLITAFCALLLVSCSNEKKAGGAATVTKNQQQTGGNIQVRIIPESPISSDDMQASYSCTGPVTLTWEKNGDVIPDQNGSRLKNDYFHYQDTITLTVRSGDKVGTATVTVGNSPPQITRVSFSPVNISRGTAVTAVPEAVDRDGDSVSFDYKWFVNGDAVAEGSSQLGGDRFRKGDTIQVEITPRDSQGSGLAYKSVPVTVSNAQPVFVTTPPSKFSGFTYSYDVVARDPDGDDVTYSLDLAPPGMVIDAKNGRIVWQIPAGESGVHTVEIVATDAEGAQTRQRYDLTLG